MPFPPPCLCGACDLFHCLFYSHYCSCFADPLHYPCVVRSVAQVPTRNCGCQHPSCLYVSCVALPRCFYVSCVTACLLAQEIDFLLCDDFLLLSLPLLLGPLLRLRLRRCFMLSLPLLLGLLLRLRLRRCFLLLLPLLLGLLLCLRLRRCFLLLLPLLLGLLLRLWRRC